MSLPHISLIDFGGPRSAPLLVLGPSLGTSVSALWTASAQHLTTDFHVVGFDLPGHGGSPPPDSAFTVGDLASAVQASVNAYLAGPYHYAGVSAGGAIGLELLLNHGDSLLSTALICTGAKIRTTDAWLERAKLIRDSGTSVMLDSAASTWFAEGFTERSPDTVAMLLTALADTNAEGYAAVCEALAYFDVRDRLGSIHGNVVTIAGADDKATPPASLSAIASKIPNARYVELNKTAHLAPAEQPELVATELLAQRQRSSR